MKKTLLSLITLCLAHSVTIAQNGTPQRCGTTQYMNDLLQKDPSWAQRLQNFETIAATADANGGGNLVNVVHTIPVVVHVVWKTATQNISDAQIQSQIDVLNADYSASNADTNLNPAAFKPLVANTQIQFCLAKQDPQGNPTTGITRTQTTVNSFTLNDAVKYTSQGGHDVWNASKYLNIWVCNLGSGLLGYAQFPGQPAATDGVVILYNAFGKIGVVTAPYHKGRSATHEVGHWLNLRHIWGDDNGTCSGTDYVSDTPNQGPENYGCPTFPNLDNCATTSPGVMSMNYMDYTDDLCMHMFTAGQSTRMNSALSGLRASLITSNGCVPTGINELGSYSIPFEVYPNPSQGIINLSSMTYLGDITVKVLSAVGQMVYEKDFTKVDHMDNLKIDLNNVADGIYVVEVKQGNNLFHKKIKIAH